MNKALLDWLVCCCPLTSSHQDVAPCGRDLESAAAGDEQAVDEQAAPEGDGVAAAVTPSSSSGSGLSKRLLPPMLLPPPTGVAGASRGRLPASCGNDLDRDAAPRGDSCGVPGPLIAVAGDGADALAVAAPGQAGCWEPNVRYTCCTRGPPAGVALAAKTGAVPGGIHDIADPVPQPPLLPTQAASGVSGAHG